MRSPNSSESIVDTSISKFNNLLSAIIDTDDLESEASSCDPANSSSSSTSSSSSSSSTTSTSSSTKKTPLSQDNQAETRLIDNSDNCNHKSPSGSNSNLDDNQLSTSLNSLSTDASSTKNEDSNNDSSSSSSRSNDKLILLIESPPVSCGDQNNSYESIAQEVELVLNSILDELVESQSKPGVSSVDELLIKLDAKLDELRAHYIELNDFYEQIQNYQNLVNRLKLNTRSTDTSNTSLILDDLLQYFDFLNDNDEISNKLETKELKLNLPDDFYLFLNNLLSQANRLIDVSAVLIS